MVARLRSWASRSATGRGFAYIFPFFSPDRSDQPGLTDAQIDAQQLASDWGTVAGDFRKSFEVERQHIST